jgi:hypothetical protein
MVKPGIPEPNENPGLKLFNLDTLFGFGGGQN